MQTILKETVWFILGCPLLSGRLLKVGEQYTNDQCTRLCTCSEDGKPACEALCPTSRITICNPPMVPKKIRVPAGPVDGKCTCEHAVCGAPGIYVVLLVILHYLCPSHMTNFTRIFYRSSKSSL